MKYKHKCSSSRELIEKLQEVVHQIRDHRTILVDWQEVDIPDETVFKVRYKEDEQTGQKQLKLKIEWGEVGDD
jgi:hypothetical protein